MGRTRDREVPPRSGLLARLLARSSRREKPAHADVDQSGSANRCTERSRLERHVRSNFPSQKRAWARMALLDACTANPFVGAYLQGYLMGKTDGCEAAVEVFEQGKKITDLEQDPDRMCFRHAKGYSRPAGAYARLITAFYEKHPEHRNIPVDYFMLLFTDSSYKTLADIEQGIRKGDVRTTF